MAGSGVSRGAAELLPAVGRVEEQGSSPRWLVVFPDEVHEPSREWFRDLAASDCSSLTLRSYGYDLLRWFRFLHVVGIARNMARREQVRGLVEYLREASCGPSWTTPAWKAAPTSWPGCSGAPCWKPVRDRRRCGWTAKWSPRGGNASARPLPGRHAPGPARRQQGRRRSPPGTRRHVSDQRARPARSARYAPAAPASG